MNDTVMSVLLPGANIAANKVAIEESDGTGISYVDLYALAAAVRNRLIASGVRRGDRVGICLRKSADAVAAQIGTMLAGAAYVPVDPSAPANRSAFIFRDCSVAVVVAERAQANELRAEFARHSFSCSWVVTDGTGAGKPLASALAALDQQDPAPVAANVPTDPDDLAYILYTSGSTGRPKGVMLTHANATSFINWCSDTFHPTIEDRFSSHAPFHFDLSILDIYVSLKHSATLVIVEEQLGKDPARLAPWIAEKRISIWYSAPSILSMLAQHGRLEQYDYSALRYVLFAGEVFPIKHLRQLKELWRKPRFFNLYGPTETNVCTFYEVPADLPPEQAEPVSIGRACSHCAPLVIDLDGVEVSKGEEGELCIAGASVLPGYWNLPEQTERAFINFAGQRWYRTGDVVVELPDGNFKFLGRRDRMIKKRGYRIELGEIEAVLYRHPRIREAAVVALNDDDGVKIRAFASTKDTAPLSIIELKTFCSQNLPLYMIPDLFCRVADLPKTSTGKTDYQHLKALA